MSYVVLLLPLNIYFCTAPIDCQSTGDFVLSVSTNPEKNSSMSVFSVKIVFTHSIGALDKYGVLNCDVAYNPFDSS